MKQIFFFFGGRPQRNPDCMTLTGSIIFSLHFTQMDQSGEAAQLQAMDKAEDVIWS